MNLMRKPIIKILIVNSRANKSNDNPEVMFVKMQVAQLFVDFDKLWEETDTSFSLSRHTISHYTALAIIRDCLTLVSLDKNCTIFEKSKIFEYNKKFNITRTDVSYLEEWLKQYWKLADDYNAFATRS